MFSHLYTGVSNFNRAFGFYDAVARALGLELRFRQADEGWAGWQLPGGGRPLFIIGQPFDGDPHHPGNGQMVAFLAPSRAAVRQVHATALQHGGSCEGPPGLRPHYHATYYGAYFRDTEGNKVGVACHGAEDQ